MLSDPEIINRTLTFSSSIHAQKMEGNKHRSMGGQASPCVFSAKSTRPLGFRIHRDSPGAVFIFFQQLLVWKYFL